MGKKITIKPKTTTRNPDLDSWVGEADSQSAPSASAMTAETPEETKKPESRETSSGTKAGKGTPAVNMKRMTLDIPKDLHRRIKQACAARDSRMVEEIRRILEREFPPLN